MSYTMQITSELICEAKGSGILFAKKGAMIADQGEFRYSKRLLGTNQGGLMRQIGNHIARRITGENLEIMEINGNGTVYLADQGAHIALIDLEPTGPFSSIVLESENILAFTDTCHYGVEVFGGGVFNSDGLFKSKLTYNGQNAIVAVKSGGNPLILEAPCRVDPDAVIAWTGKNPSIVPNVDFKAIIGQTSGESYIFSFNEPGQTVLVQPYERKSQVGLSVDGHTARSTYNSLNLRR